MDKPQLALHINQQHQSKKSSTLAGPIPKVLPQVFNASVSQHFCKLLYPFLPGDQRKNGAEIAAFCFFIQKQHQICVKKSSMVKMLVRGGLFQEEFFMNIYGEAEQEPSISEERSSASMASQKRLRTSSSVS